HLEKMHLLVSHLTALIGSTSQIQIWNIKPTSSTFEQVENLLEAALWVVPLFALLVFMFIPIGQHVGSLLERAPRGVRGYTINVLGSLVGILIYTALCFFYQTPAVWFLVAAVLVFFVFLRRQKTLTIFAGA